MANHTESVRWSDRNPTLQYVLPFGLFLAFLTASSRHLLSPYWEAPLWVVALGLVCVYCWPRELTAVPKYWLPSIGIGLLVFLLWIAPDYLIPGYRSSALFSNSIVGSSHSSITAEQLRSPWILAWRTARAVLIVPVVEELFWRAWLMRWLINIDFQRVRLGAYTALSFWVSALLFASEHGPYWDVGLLAGIVYNFWIIRTRSLADCILMHAATNAALSAFIIARGQWQYWL